LRVTSRGLGDVYKRQMRVRGVVMKMRRLAPMGRRFIFTV
jgi:hypothetical protein